MPNDAAQPDPLRIADPRDEAEPIRAADGEFAETVLAVNLRCKAVDAVTWVWLWLTAAGRVRLAITAQHVAAGTGCGERAALDRLNRLADAGLILVTPVEGRGGGIDVILFDAADVLSDELRIVRAEPQLDLPFGEDANSQSGAPPTASLGLVAGGKGGAVSSTSLSSAALTWSSTSDVRRQTSVETRRDDQIKKQEGDVDETWENARERAQRTVNKVPLLKPKDDSNRELMLKYCYLVETGRWSEALLTDATEGVRLVQNVRAPYGLLWTILEEKHPAGRSGLCCDLARVTIPRAILQRARAPPAQSA